MPTRRRGATSIEGFGRKNVSTARYLQTFGEDARTVRWRALSVARTSTDSRNRAIARNVARRKSLGGQGG